MLEREEILKKLRQRREDMRVSFSVQHIGLFGSYLHGRESEKSDIDLIVALSDPTFDHYMDLKFYLEALLKGPVDLVISTTLKPRLKPVIMKEAVYA